MPPKKPSPAPFVSPFAALSQQARSGSVELTSALGDLAQGDLVASGQVSPDGLGRRPSPLPRRRGSAGGDAAEGTRDAFITTAQEQRLRDASLAVQKDLAARQGSGGGSLGQSGPPTRKPSFTMPRIGRSGPRKSLEQFYQFPLGRSAGNSGRDTPNRSSANNSESTTATPSVASLSATTQDLVDLETLRRNRIGNRMSMATALPGIDESIEAIAPPTTSGTINRAAFGFGTGWTILTPDGPPSQAVQLALAYYAEETEEKRSWVPVIKVVPTVAGKLAVALGADMLTLGLSNGNVQLRWGGGLAIGLGIVSVCSGMVALMFDMKKINPGRIPATFFFSLLGMIITTVGLVVGEMDIGARSLAVRSSAAVVIGIGLVLLNESLPLSFAYSELVHGDCFRSYRNEWARFVQGIGIGAATGLTLSRGAPRDNIMPAVFPFGVAHGFAVLGIAMVTIQNCLVTTNVQRGQGKLFALRTRLHRLAQQVRQADTSRSPPEP